MLRPHRRPFASRLLLAALTALSACGLPSRAALISEDHGELEPLPGFEHVRAVDGYPSPSLQESFDQAVASFARAPVPEDGRRDFPMLVLSSGGVNGAFGAGVLTGWTKRGDRPPFWFVTGVSVGALLAPFVFAGPEFDDRMEELFRRIEPGDLHREKGMLGSVLWDESLMDNSPLRKSIERGVDHELLRAVAARHAEGRRCLVGSTNLDLGEFIVWDMGAIATRGDDAALKLFRQVLTASASIPVVYPPVRFKHGERDELHADGAVIRPLFIPQNVFDGYASAERAGMSWDDVDATMYVVHNGSLRPRAAKVPRDTLAIATRTVVMMSYTMVAEHVLHLYMLSRAWGADFRFVTLPDGLELPVNDFTPNDTERLFLLGQGLMEQDTAWASAPPGYVLHEDLGRISPALSEATASDLDELRAQLSKIEELLSSVRAQLGASR
ncbi:MAG: patatin-like phospholipase family protein [Planctomycetota bacterium]